MISLYLFTYVFLLFVFVFILSQNEFTRFKLSNLFLFAHFTIFFFTPLLFSQEYFFENTNFFWSSIISLVSIFVAFLVPVINTRFYFVPKIKYISFVFIVFLIVTMFNLYSGYIGIGEDKIMESLSGEMTGRGIGSVLKSLVAILSLIYLSYLFQNKRKQFILLYLLYLISVVMTAAHRTPVIIAFIMPFLLWILHDRKGYVPKYFIAFSSVGVVFLMYIFNFYRQGMTQQLMEANITLKSAFMNSFSGLNTSKYFYELLNSDLKIEYFEKAYYWIITYIPRRLWEDKPIVSFNVRITEELFGYTVGDFKGADVATFTVPGEGFYQFGYVGVFLLTFAAVYMSRVLVAFYLRILYSELLLIGFMLSVLINFRSAFDSFLHSIIFSFLFTIVLIPFFFYVNKNVPVQNKYLRN